MGSFIMFCLIRGGQQAPMGFSMKRRRRTNELPCGFRGVFGGGDGRGSVRSFELFIDIWDRCVRVAHLIMGVIRTQEGFGLSPFSISTHMIRPEADKKLLNGSYLNHTMEIQLTYRVSNY